MILSNQCIVRAMKDYLLYISPFESRNVQPASYDLLLSDSFALQDEPWTTTSFTLWPGQFILGSTRERISLGPEIMGIVSGCSTEGRRGLIVEMAGVIDPGFDGQITLEIYNCGRDAFHLKAGMRIAQIVFYRLCCPAEPAYNGRYQHQEGASAAKETL